MKTHSDELFLLIKAMSPKEKLFLKAYSRKSPNDGDYSYFILFDILNEMAKYDEAALRNKLAKRGYKHNLGKAKNYLTKAILKSLTEYHSQTSIDTIIENHIFQAEILYKKKMDAMADKILRKAEKLALEYEKDEYLLMITSLKTNTALEFSNIERLKEHVRTGIKKEQEYLKHFINTIEYRNLAAEITLLNQSPMLVAEEKTKNIHLKKLFESPLLKDSKSALSLTAKKYFYQLNYSRFHNQDKWDNGSYRTLTEWVKFLESKKKLLQNLPEFYIRALNSLLGALANMTGKEKEIETTYEKARNFYTSIPKKNVNKNLHRTFAHLMVNYSFAQFRLFAPEKTLKEFAKLNHSIRAELDLAAYFNIAWSYFYMGNYPEALSCINKVVNTKSDFRKDLQAEGRSLLLIAHYELGNMYLLPHIAKSCERWLVKNNYPLNDFNKRRINFFRYNAPKITNPEEEAKELSELLTDLKRLDPAEIVIPSWVEGKIHNRPMFDIYKEKYTQSKGTN